MAAVVSLKRSKIDGIHSPDVDWTAGGQPADANNFSVLLQIMVGVEGEKGADTFDMLVVTPLWLMDELQRKQGEPIDGRHTIIVQKWDRRVIEGNIRRTFEGIEGKAWEDIAVVLSRFGRWEFEDYKE